MPTQKQDGANAGFKTVAELVFPNLAKLIATNASAQAEHLRKLATLHRKQREMEGGKH